MGGHLIQCSYSSAYGGMPRVVSIDLSTNALAPRQHLRPGQHTWQLERDRNNGGSTKD